MTTQTEAIDDISKMISDVFTEEILWEDVPKDRPVSSTPWALFRIRHATARQATLGGKGKRSFLRKGIIIMAIFAPGGNGLSIARPLAKMAADAYEGNSSPNGVWFRDVRTVEIGRDGSYYQVNMLAEFEYYETK